MPINDDRKTEETEAIPDTSGRKSSIVKWTLVGAIQVLFIGLMVLIAKIAVDSIKSSQVSEAELKRQEESDKERAERKKQTVMGTTLAAPIEVTVNVRDEEGRYVKCGVQLEYDPSYAKLGAELETRKVRIKNIIIDVMGGATLGELTTNDGKKIIRQRIVEEVNSILPEEVDGKILGKVDRSYFDSFMMQ